MPYDETLQVSVKLDSREAEQKIDQLKAKAQVEVGTDKITQSLETIDDEFDKIFNDKKSNSLAAKLKNSFNAIEKPLKEVQSRLKSDFIDIKINPEMQLDNGGYSREDLINMTLMNSQGQQVNLDANSIDAYLNLRKQIDDAYASVDEFINKQKELEKQMQEIAHAADIHDWGEDEEGYYEIGIEEETASQMIDKLKLKYDELSESINKANAAVRKLSEEQQKLLDSSPVKTDKKSPKESMLDIDSGISRLAKAFSLGTLLFKLILKVVNLLEQSIQNGLENVYNWSADNGYRYKDSKDAFASAGNYVDNAMGALAEFVWNDLEPVLYSFLIAFAEIIQSVTATIANIKMLLTGEEQTYLEASLVNIEAADAQSKNNKDLKKLISGFDELNIWSKSNSSDSSKYDNAFTEKAVKVTGLGKVISWIVNAIESISKIANLIPAVNMNNLSRIFDSDFWDGIGKMASGFEQMFTDYEGGKKAMAEGFYQAFLKPISDGLKEAFNISLNDIVKWLSNISKELAKITLKIILTIELIREKFVNAIVSFFEHIVNSLVNAYNEATGWLNEVFNWKIAPLANVEFAKYDTSVVQAKIAEIDSIEDKVSGGSTLKDVVDAIKDSSKANWYSGSTDSRYTPNYKNIAQKQLRAY